MGYRRQRIPEALITLFIGGYDHGGTPSHGIGRHYVGTRASRQWRRSGLALPVLVESTFQLFLKNTGASTSSIGLMPGLLSAESGSSPCWLRAPRRTSRASVTRHHHRTSRHPFDSRIRHGAHRPEPRGFVVSSFFYALPWPSGNAAGVAELHRHIFTERRMFRALGDAHHLKCRFLGKLSREIRRGAPSPTRT